MAKIIAEQLHADCLEIIPQKSYPQAYNAVVNQAKITATAKIKLPS